MDALRRDHHRHAAPAAARSRVTSPRRASASCCSSEATGCRASRRTGSPQDVFVDNRYVSRGHLVRRRAASRSSRRVHYFVGGATKLYGAALYRLRKEDFGELQHHDGISPAWPISYDELEPYYTQAEQLYQVHGARGEDPTEPPASAPYPFPPSRTSRGSSSSPTTSRRPATTRSTRRAGSARRVEPAYSTCVRCTTCDGFPCPVHGKSDAEVLGVRPALEHANVTLLTNAKARQARDERRRAPRVTEVVVERDGEPRSASRPTSSWSRAAPRTPPSCCSARRTTRTRTASPTARTRSAATTCSTTARRCSRSRARRTRRSSRRRSGSTTSTSRNGDFEYPLGNIQMVGKSQAPMYRGEKPGETKLAPEWTLERIAKHAIDFWLSTEDLPRPDNRVTRRPGRQAHAQLHGDEREAEAAALREAASRCSASST